MSNARVVGFSKPVFGVGALGSLFTDGFDYTIGRTDSGTSKRTAFSNAGWNGSSCKDMTTDGGGYGWLYTTTATRDSTGRALVLEARPDLAPNFDGEHQTDFYLTYGVASEGDTETVPGDVWFTWWTYGTVGSEYFGADKLIYPTFATSHETSTLHWMLLQGSQAYAQSGGYPPVAVGARRFGVYANDANNAAADVGLGMNVHWLYQNLNQTGALEGVWYQVKVHFDTSGAQGTWEMWRRQYGTSEWTKLAEWIGGVTTIPHWDTGNPITFQWQLGSYSGASASGHTAFKMPTVVVCTDADPHYNYNYMDDFSMYASDPG